MPRREDQPALTAASRRTLPAVSSSVTALRHAVAGFVVVAGIGELVLAGIAVGADRQ